MATVNVAAYNTRVDPAESVTDWNPFSGGGSPTLETDIVYQGTNSVSNKVGTSRQGVEYDGPTNYDITDKAVGLAWIAKYNVSNPKALLSRTAPSVTVLIGSANNQFNEYYIDGVLSYPAAGGWRLIAIDPDLYTRDAGTGTVDYTQISYFGLVGDFAASSKTDNLALDAIDLGNGLNLTGGDGGDTNGTFQDFINYDEGNTENRFGYVSSKEGILYVNGSLTIGEETGSTETSVATEFGDDGSVVVWNNGYFATNWANLKLNIANSSTLIDLENTTFIGRGEVNNTFDGRITSTQDTRPSLIITGSLGQVTSSGCVYQNFNSSSLNEKVRFTGGSLETDYMIQSGSHVDAVKITTTSTSSVATLQDFTGTQTGTSGLYNCTFVQGNDGHAMVISGSSFDFYGLKFQGYGNTTSDSASVYVNASTGTVTINLFNDGDTPTYKSDGATVNIVQSVQLRVSNAVSGSEVQLVSSSGAELDTVAGTNFQIDETTGRLPTQASSNNFATYNYNYPGYDQEIYVIVHSLGYEYQLIEATLGSVGQTIRTSQVEDRNYDEGQTPFDPI